MAIRGEFIETVVGNPPEGWTLGHVTLQLYRPEERRAVEAWRHGAFAVHQRDSIEFPARLTHAPTGLRINDFYSMDDAAMCAEQIEPLTDWNAITEMMPSGSELYPKVRQVIEVLKWRPSSVTSTDRCEGK